MLMGVTSDKSSIATVPVQRNSSNGIKWLAKKSRERSTDMKFGCKKSFYEPSGLLDHLGAQKDPLHRGVLAYVKELFLKDKKA